MNPGDISQGPLCRADVVTAVTKLTSPVLSHSWAPGGLHTCDFTSPLQWHWIKLGFSGWPKGHQPTGASPALQSGPD